VSKDFDILDFTPADKDLLNGQSVLVSDAGEFKRITKIKNETFVEILSLNDEDGERENGHTSSNDSTDTKTQTDLEFSNGNIIISSEESYFQVRDDSDVIRAQLGQVTTDNFGLKISKANGTEIFGLYGSVANLCGWNIDESAISKVSGNDYVKLDTSSSQPRLEIAQNNVVRLKAGQLDSDKYGLKIWNASAQVLLEISDGDIAADTANIGGWNITSSTLSKGSNISLDATNKKITINNATFGNSGLQLDYNGGTPRAYFGDGSNAFFKYDGSKITWKASNAELDANGKLTVTGATIGGWNIASNEISSSASTSAKRIFLNPSDHRVEVRSTGNVAVVAMGYLGGLAKTSGSGSWASTDYGFWIKAGDTAKIDGDVEYKDGAFLVQSDGSFNIADSSNTIVKLGTISNERGLFIGSDLDGSPSVKAKFTNGGFRIGAQSGSGDYISYDASGGLVVKGAITIEGGISLDDLDSTVITGGLIKTGLVSATNITAGTLTGRTIQTATSGQRVVIDGSNNQIDFYDASNKIMSLDSDVVELQTGNTGYGQTGSGSQKPGLKFENGGLIYFGSDNYINSTRINWQNGRAIIADYNLGHGITFGSTPAYNDIVFRCETSGAASNGTNQGIAPVYAGWFKATHLNTAQIPYALWVEDGYTKLEDVYVDGNIRQGAHTGVNYYGESTQAYPTLSLYDTSDSSYAQPALSLITRGTNSNGTIPSGHDMGGIYFVNDTDHYSDWRGDKIRAMIDTYVTTNGFWSAGVDMQFWTAAANGENTKRMTIEDTGQVRIFDALKIGADSTPSYVLHITKSVNDYISVISNSYSTGLGQVIQAGANSSQIILRLDNQSGGNQFYFDAGGNAAKASGAGDWAGISDIRVKKNIEDLNIDALSVLNTLRPVEFNWKEEEIHNNPKDSGGKTYGFIADEIESVMPQLVITTKLLEDSPDSEYVDEDGIAKATELGHMASLYVKAIQQLLTKIETLETKVTNLENA
jgi:hypothetical protein